MSTETTSECHDSPRLVDLIKRELQSIPLEQWGYFFPCQIAIWRFVECREPGFLGPLDAGYDSEPFFRGKGSRWFCRVLGNDDSVLALLEEIMYQTVDSLPGDALERGFVKAQEVPELGAKETEALEQAVLTLVRAAR